MLKGIFLTCSGLRLRLLRLRLLETAAASEINSSECACLWLDADLGWAPPFNINVCAGAVEVVIEEGGERKAAGREWVGAGWDKRCQRCSALTISILVMAC